MTTEIGHHWIVELPGLHAPFNHVNMDTLMMMWLAMGLIVLVTILIRANLKLYPSTFQVFGESIYDFCRGITLNTAGTRGDAFLFYVGSLFIFILTANLLGQLPWHFIQLMLHYDRGELGAATGDFNTTAALAIFTLIMYFVVGIRKKGLKYFLHYVHPHFLFLPINMVEDVIRPFSLMLRLYANIFVGEILSMLALKLVPVGLPVAVIFLELFVAVVQAYIFAILSSVYISMLSAESH